MITRVPTLIVGAGQAGLALSRCLTDADHEHLLLERGLVAQRWRSERWDSFRLLSPNWQTRLPGFRYDGNDPDGFMRRGEIVRFFDRYADSFAAPVRTGVTVTAVDPAEHGWTVRTDRGRYEAANVVVASGHYDRPAVPAVARTLPPYVHQVHNWRYRNPQRLPEGAVLVVGAGPSGQQIADELARSGRRVYLAVGHHRPLPRRYRGRDVYWWMDRTGMLDRTVDSLPAARSPGRAPSVVLAGEEKDLDLRRLVSHGVEPLGRLRGVDGARLRFADDLPARLAEADGNVRRLREAVDAYVTRTGLPAPAEAADPPAPAPWAVTAPTELDLAAAGITVVIWATGYRRDHSWVHAPVFGADREPVQRRGVTAAEGLYFLGLHWMYRRKSNSIDGVGSDAEYLADRIIDASSGAAARDELSAVA